MSLLPFFKWCDETTLGQAIRGVTWAFPMIETIHIFALIGLVGGTLMVDIALLGGLKRLGPAHIAQQVKPFVIWGLIVMLITGIMLFLSEALKCYDNDAFKPKMILLALAMVWQATVHRKAQASETSGTGKLAAVVSLVLWFGVGVAGRAIGFV
jgi:hypothetical protein